MDIDDRIKLVADEIRSYGAITLLGAGISLSQGFPLTRNLQMLLWNALDSDEDARKELAAKLGQKLSNAKELIGDDPTKTDLALKILASSQIARKTFQNSFKSLNDVKIKEPSIVHEIVCELLHRGYIKIAISLNWDTLLETAYHQHYGGTLHSGNNWLKKPHGDAANPDDKWTLPNESVNLPESIITEISQLEEDYPCVLLIIGYSERDEEIVSKIIEPLSDQWRVIRIGPDASDENSIPLTAEEALPKLYEDILINPEIPEIPGCEYINFDNQHDLGSALSGIGLGPADVDACPRLPEVNVVKQQLETAGSSVTIGKMGSGKSLIAYQTAYDLNKDGWEILRLKKLNQPKEQLIAKLLSLPRKTVLIIDNAQTFDEDVVNYILENATDKLRVLVSTTDDNISRYNKIHVAGERAVSFIAENFRNRKTEILPIVQRLDWSIGEGYHDIDLESRINDAEKSSKYPWQFNFILTAGWLRAESEITSLRENERFDLLLAAISIKQIISLDTGSPLEWLEKASQILGKDKEWMDLALEELKSRRLIVEGNTIRCPHVRFSSVTIKLIYENQEDDFHDQLINLFRNALNEEIPSLKGIFWAFDILFSSSDLFKEILDSQSLDAIMNRCWEPNSNEDINYASRVLTRLFSWFPDLIDDFRSNSELIAKWIEKADGKSAYGLGSLLNDLGLEDHELAEDIINLVDPQIIADNLSQIGISDSYVWGFLLGRFVYAASEEWCVQLKDSLNFSSLHSLFFKVEEKAVDLFSLSEFAQGITALDHSLGIKLVDLAIPKIASAINKNIIRFQDVDDIIFFVLGFAPDFLRRDEPSHDQKHVAKKLADNINADAVAQFISNSRIRDWRNYADLIQFLEEASPDKASEIAKLVDLNILDETSKGLWKNQTYDLLYMVRALALGDDCEPARSWIDRHSEEFVSLNPIVVAIAPEATTNILRQGYDLVLKLEDLADWGLAYLVIRRLSEVDKELASIIIKSNQIPITQGFELKNHSSNYKGFPEFINIMSELEPDVLKECLESIEPTVIRNSWPERLKGNSEEQQAAETLINLIIDKNVTSLLDIVQEFEYNH